VKDIIVVEDSALERERLERVFSTAGYRVVLCERAADAERELKEEQFRLALLDIGLSDRSGSYLFAAMRRSGRVGQIVIFTGNPSGHLKQRFMDEGAADYIVKGSQAAQTDELLARVELLIGPAEQVIVEGLELDLFLRRCVDPASRALFLDADGQSPQCSKCSGRDFVVTFAHRPQVPPEVLGNVVCRQCGDPLDPTVG